MKKFIFNDFIKTKMYESSFFLLIIAMQCTLLSCGLPSATVVSAPRVVSVAGTKVTFDMEQSDGFVLYYRVYTASQIPERELTGSGYSREEDIFRSYNYLKSYPSSASSSVRPRLIWRPMNGVPAPPYRVILDVFNGEIEISSAGNVVFTDQLVRNNLLSFENFSRSDTDLPDGFNGVTGQLAWAAMNTSLNQQTVTVENSKPVYLHHIDISIYY